MEDVALACSGKIGLFLVISLSSYTNIAHDQHQVNCYRKPFSSKLSQPRRRIEMGEMGLIWECFLTRLSYTERMFCPRKTLERIASQNRKQWIDCNWNVGSRRKSCSSEGPLN